jgi:Arc/MetJ-type ribon-helix-helix transcriptional regulator
MARHGDADDPTETISASVPSSLAASIREHVGKRGFSQFVTQALRRELVSRNRKAIIAEYVAKFGPLDPAGLENARQLLN